MISLRMRQAAVAARRLQQAGRNWSHPLAMSRLKTKDATLLPNARWFSTEPVPPAGKESRDQLLEVIENEIKKDEEEFLPKKHTASIKDVHRFNMRELDTYDRGELDKTAVHDDMPLSLRERRQTNIVFETFKEKAQWGEFYRMYGILLLVLGGYFLTVPFYTLVCQTFGFTLATHAKDYRRKDEEISVFRKFRIGFLSLT